MLLWAGLIMIVVGLACFRIDRRATNYFYDHVGGRLHRFLQKTTHLAKAAHWLFAAVTIFAASWAWLHWCHETPAVRLAYDSAAAFIIALALGTVILHTIKLLLGRRRPRDEIEMKLYGFLPFAFDLRMNSFPSGHALTICIVAAMASCLWPLGMPLWFALALWLALTRALLSAHFLSDVFVGAGIGLLSARLVLLNFFPQLSPPWL